MVFSLYVVVCELLVGREVVVACERTHLNTSLGERAQKVVVDSGVIVEVGACLFEVFIVVLLVLRSLWIYIREYIVSFDMILFID